MNELVWECLEIDKNIIKYNYENNTQISFTITNLKLQKENELEIKSILDQLRNTNSNIDMDSIIDTYSSIIDMSFF